MTKSKKSVGRLIKEYSSLNPTPYSYFQTLTFGEPLSIEEMRRRLEFWLDEVARKYPNMVLIWLYEEKTRRHLFRPHFHVYLFLYQEFKYSEETMRERLLKPLFKRWNGINGGKLNQKANLLTWHEEGKRGINYVLKHVKLPRNNQKTERERTWWGVWNHKAAKANSTSGNGDQKGITKLASDWEKARRKSENEKRRIRRGRRRAKVREFLQEAYDRATQDKMDRKPCFDGITSIEGSTGAICNLSNVDNAWTLNHPQFPVWSIPSNPVVEHPEPF